MATEVKIPDIGDYKDVPIIEVHVKEGDPVNADDPLVSLESDKATMEVPAPSAGIVEKLLIKLGDKVSEGHPIVLLKDGDAAVPEPPSLIEQQEPTPPPDRAPSPPATAPAKPNGQESRRTLGRCMPVRACDVWRANSNSILRPSVGPARRAGSPRTTSKRL